DKRTKVAEEIADVLLYLLKLADKLNIDPLNAARMKMRINGEKYTVKQAKGTCKKYSELCQKDTGDSGVIVYQATKSTFIKDCDNREIEEIIASKYVQHAGRYAHQAEVRSWKASLTEMARVLRDPNIPDDVGIGVEFGIPQTGKRIDFILSGTSENERPRLIIVELKQWSEAKLCVQDGIILARRGGPAEREGT